MPKSTTPEKTPPAAATDGRGFFQRWSERKTEATTESAREATLDQTRDDPGPQLTTDKAAEEQASEAAQPPPEVTEADLENLTYESDYTKFLGEHVPDALRRRALRTLWRSDPILANLDGLCDYDDDYTDAALAVKVLQTAHKVGQGYLTDEDLAANRARGEPKPEETSASDDELDEDGGEDIEDFDDNEVLEDETTVASAESQEPEPTTSNETSRNSADLTVGTAITDVAKS